MSGNPYGSIVAFLFIPLADQNVRILKSHFQIFTNFTLWASSVIKSRCSFVCVSVTKVVIVDNGHTVKFWYFFIELSG